MTTEVFRNMLYDSEETGELEDVFAVVFDEFHYMNDRDRGTVSALFAGRIALSLLDDAVALREWHGQGYVS